MDEEDSQLGDEFERKEREQASPLKVRGNPPLNVREEDLDEETYSQIKRKNKNNLFTPDRDKASQLMQSMEVDDFEGSDYEDRPASRKERPGSRGKGHLGVSDSSNYDSEDDTNSVRRQRQSAIQRLRKKNDILKMDEKSDYSGDE